MSAFGWPLQRSLSIPALGVWYHCHTEPIRLMAVATPAPEIRARHLDAIAPGERAVSATELGLEESSNQDQMCKTPEQQLPPKARTSLFQSHGPAHPGDCPLRTPSMRCWPRCPLHRSTSSARQRQQLHHRVGRAPTRNRTFLVL